MHDDGHDSIPALAARIAELETRVAFQEHALAEMSDALAESRLEAARVGERLHRVLDELRSLRESPFADPAAEPPPPHY
jgi:SlyX protein